MLGHDATSTLIPANSFVERGQTTRGHHETVGGCYQGPVGLLLGATYLSTHIVIIFITM